jgi:glycosyltransferase involved in cell wall biosynthesis
MSKEIQISSVMLCFNRVSLSRKCLNSYLNTISVPYELVIVDNASTDGTREWLEDVIRDPRIREVIHMEQNDPATGLNKGLATCIGKYLHVMENDYIYLDGWDKYVLNCFNEIANLGQLCICPGARRLIGEHHRNLVYLSTGNVVSSSVFPRTIFFDYHIRWQNIYKGSMPDDTEFSRAVKKAGFMVAWPDRPIAVAVGFFPEEFKRDPDYYIRNYRQKLASLQVRSVVQQMLRLHIDPNIKESMARLFMLYWTKFTKGYLP